MRNLKKCFVASIILFLGHLQYSQAQFWLGVGLSASFPDKDFNRLANFGGGFYLEPKCLISNRFLTGIHLSFLAFSGEDQDNISSRSNAIDLEVSPYFIVPVTVFGDYLF